MKKIKQVLGLIKRAGRDFELAKKYESAKEYVTASTLYRKAVEKTLLALIIKHGNKQVPTNASVNYLVEETKLPFELDLEQVTYRTIDYDVLDAEEVVAGIEEKEMLPKMKKKEYVNTISMHETVRRLLGYANANV